MDSNSIAVSAVAPIIRQLTRIGLLLQIKFHLYHGIQRSVKRATRQDRPDYQFSGNIEELLFKSSLDDLGTKVLDNLIRMVLGELKSEDLRIEYPANPHIEQSKMDLMVPGG